jgi:uncharacterized protein (TIGR02118 family)
MIKVIVTIVRKQGLSAQEFHEHWRNQHARLVTSCAASKRYIRRYIQCHTLPEQQAAGEPAFDGVAELWFDSVADKDRFFADPDYIREVQPDEARFADMQRTKFIVTQEETVI